MVVTMHAGGETDFQRDLVGLVSGVTEGLGYALAGSAALREHGIVSRRTRDIDMFTTLENATAMGADGTFRELVVEPVERAAAARGISCSVDFVADGSCFAKMTFSRGSLSVEADIGADFRSEPPVQMEFGPVIARDDSVDGKLSTLFGRGEPRDYYDAWGIIVGEGLRFADVVERISRFDAGIQGSEALLVKSMKRALSLDFSQLGEYGVSRGEVDEMLAFYRDVLPGWEEEAGC